MMSDVAKDRRDQGRKTRITSHRHKIPLGPTKTETPAVDIGLNFEFINFNESVAQFRLNACSKAHRSYYWLNDALFHLVDLCPMLFFCITHNVKTPVSLLPLISCLVARFLGGRD